MHHPLTILLMLLCTATAVAVFARRFRIPYSTALVVTALVLGAYRLLPPVVLDSDFVMQLFLPVLLFEAAINTDASHLRDNLRPVLLLSTAGMVVMTGVTGALLHVGLGFDWPVALLVGSMLSITDTVAVLAIFKDVKVPQRLATIVEGESLLNDGTALVLFRTLLAVVVTQTFGPAQASLAIVVVAVGGLVVGGVLGLVASYVLAQVQDHLTEIMITTVLALGAYFMAESVHVSGVIAVVVAGLVVGNYGWRRALAPSSQIALGSFWEYAGFGVNSAVFLLVGLSINYVDWTSYIGGIAFAFFAVQVGRAVAIYPGFWVLARLAAESVPLRWLHVMQWGNIKGSLTMALALSLPTAVPHRTDLITIIFGVVLLSLVLQGLTLGPLVRTLRVAEPSSLRLRFEQAQLRIIASRAAQQEIAALQEAGILSKGAHERLRARYQVGIAQAERELRQLGAEHPGYYDEVIEETRQRLRLVEKGAVNNALRRGLVSSEVAARFVADLDEQLVAGQLPLGEPPS